MVVQYFYVQDPCASFPLILMKKLESSTYELEQTLPTALGDCIMQLVIYLQSKCELMFQHTYKIRIGISQRSTDEIKNKNVEGKPACILQVQENQYLQPIPGSLLPLYFQHLLASGDMESHVVQEREQHVY